MIQVKSQVKLRILTIFNFCVEMGKLKKSTVFQNSKNLVCLYETSEKIRSSDQNISWFQSPTLIIWYTVLVLVFQNENKALARSCARLVPVFKNTCVQGLYFDRNEWNSVNFAIFTFENLKNDSLFEVIFNLEQVGHKKQSTIWQYTLKITRLGSYL